ncbi:MAG: hypothetical protein HQ562_10480 [Candidatus Marinimicrobia bacterium]|nr:hypothetical protein [Candidatus Neomarinimicrobiota bacterium]
MKIIKMNLIKLNNLKILSRLLLLSIPIIVITIWSVLTLINPVEPVVTLNDKSLTYYYKSQSGIKIHDQAKGMLLLDKSGNIAINSSSKNIAKCCSNSNLKPGIYEALYEWSTLVGRQSGNNNHPVKLER